MEDTDSNMPDLDNSMDEEQEPAQPGTNMSFQFAPEAAPQHQSSGEDSDGPPPLVDNSSTDDDDNEPARGQSRPPHSGAGHPPPQGSQPVHPSHPPAPSNPYDPQQMYQGHFVFQMPPAPMGAPTFDNINALMGQVFGGQAIVGGMMGGREEGGNGFAPFVQMFQSGDPLFQVLQASFNQARPGKPCASPASIETVAFVKVQDGEIIECPISAGPVEVGEWAARMPCGHWFAAEPLTTWLGQQNTCPVCRFELHTVDEDYNRQKNLTLDRCAETAENMSRNPQDLIYKRVGRARELAILDEIVEMASREVLPCDHTNCDEKVDGEIAWADRMCDEVLHELMAQ